MPPYKETDLTQRGTLKFLRVDGQLIVGDLKTAHRDLAINDGILDTLNRARYEDKSRVDAGIVEITENTIHVYDQSVSLGVRLVPEVRAKTVEIFKEQTTSRLVDFGS